MRRLVILLIVIAVIVAAYILVKSPQATALSSSAGQAAVVSNPVNSPLLAPTATTGVQVNPTAIPANVDLGSMPSPRALVWNPNTMQLAWYAANTSPIPVGKLSNAKALLIPCGSTVAGDKSIIYEGGDVAQPVLLPIGSGAAMPLGANTGLACALPGRVQFSPDGNRLGILKYDQTIGNQGGIQVFAPGTLRVLKMPEGTEQASIDNVIAFDLQNDGATALQFFTNTKGQAKNADLIFWDGSKMRKIEENIQLLNTDSKADCAFVTARVLRVQDKVYTLFGERCKQGGSSWRLRRADVAGGNAADVISGPTGSSGNATYFVSTATNDMFLMPSGKEIMFMVPNGTAADVANIARITIPDGKLNNVQAGIVVSSYPPVKQNQFQFSPKHDMLAMTTRSGDGAEQLFLYDLNSPDTAPVSIAGGSKLDRINGDAWSADGQTLYYNMVGDTQALFAYTVKGSSKIVARGTFENLALSGDGTQAVVSEQVKASPTDTRHNLVVISTADGTKTNIVEGAKNEQAIAPLLVH